MQKYWKLVPGGGYNTLAFFKWNVKHADLVEANPQGIDDMKILFKKYEVPNNKFSIFQSNIENFQTNKRYDIIIAEGFLPNMYNQREVIRQLQDLLVSGGIVVITCIDNVSMFIEAMKRLVGIWLSMDIKEYNDKVEYLARVFEPQLHRMKGVSRSAKEWVQDQILNPAGINGTELSLVQAIEYFGEKFDILGSSPQMFTDYSWYKDIWYDYKKDYKAQFAEKRLSLLQANTPEVILPIEQADKLVSHFVNIKHLAAEYEKTLEMDNIEKIIDEMLIMKEMASQYLSDSFMNVFREIMDIVGNIRRNKGVIMEEYPLFFEAFGRAQQYIAFVKK